MDKIRINILQMSVSNRDGLEEAMKLCLDYIWKYTNAEEVRIGIHHFEVEEKGKEVLKVDEEYKSCLKRFKFKWKQIISNAGGTRILVMGANRPAEYPLQKGQDNTFKIKMATLFAIKKVEDRKAKINASTDVGAVSQNRSYFLTPTVFIQPLIFNGKEDAEQAIFANEGLTSPPLQLMTSYVRQVVDQIEFTNFPITVGTSSDKIQDCI